MAGRLADHWHVVRFIRSSVTGKKPRGPTEPSWRHLPGQRPRAKKRYEEQVFTAGLLGTRHFSHFASFNLHNSDMGRIVIIPVL